MRHQILLILLVLLTLEIPAQTSGTGDILAGNYSSTFNGANVTLRIKHKQGASYTGVMNDSYQTIKMTLQRSGTEVKGEATEPTLGITFQIQGEVLGDELALNFKVDFMGENNTMDILFTRDIETTEPEGSNDFPEPTSLVFPVGAEHPVDITGTWSKDEMYQSGSGSNYMGAGFTESMTFLPDGHIAEGGSAASISGSNYSGQSTGAGSGVIQGLAWYTMGNRIFLQVTDAGKTQNMPLGTFYIEGNNMLITGTSGEKLLLTKSNKF
jgi:hypothetical protein